MIEQEAKEVLRRQVAVMMDELKEIALEKLEILMNSGVGLVEQQVERSSEYRCETSGSAKDFMVAFLGHQPGHYRRPFETREDKKRIKNYSLFI